MPQRAIIVSPDEGLVTILCRGLAATGVCDQPTFLSYYPEVAELRELIDSQTGPVAVVLFDLTGQSRALDLIRRLRDSHPNVVTLAVDQAPSRASFNGATEAGAWGYLAPPFDIAPLAEHFQLGREFEPEPIAPVIKKAEPPSAPTGKLISFMPVQGGNGASTIALHVAEGLAYEDEKTVLLDFDFHSGTVAFRLRLKPQYTVVNLLESREFNDREWAELTTPAHHFHVMIAPTSNTAISGKMLDRIPAVLESARRVYGYTIADLPDPLFSSSRHILQSSDRVYLVCTPEITSLHLARRKAQQLREAGVSDEKLSLVVNRVGAWGSFQPSEVQRVVGTRVVWTLGNDYASLREATLQGSLVAEDSGLGAELRGLAEHIRTSLQEASAARVS